MTDYASALQRAGLSAGAAEGKVTTFEQLQHAAGHFGFRNPLSAFYVPGRIEVLGKHTDYAGGRSLLCCVERGFCLLAAARDDRKVRFIDLSRNSTAEWELTPQITAAPVSWAIYPVTVTRRVARNFPSAQHGVDVVFSSDLPRAAGMSSSSAFVIASFFALAAANKLEDTEDFLRHLPAKKDLAAYLACVENGRSFGALSGDTGVGTFGGSEDHTAILCCEPAKISQFSFCPLQFERSIKVPEGLTFVIGVSGVVAEKTGRAQQQYNRLSLATEGILKIWNEASGRWDPSLGSAAASSPGAADQIRGLLRRSPDSDVSATFLRARFDQFFAETYEVVLAAGDALERCDWDQFGKLVDVSQSYAEKLLENQVPETSFLARSARELGAIAASTFGAGFGGSVWALVKTRNCHNFLEQWSSRYGDQFPELVSATFFLSQIGPPEQQLCDVPHSGPK
jgi:galactokinase